MSNVQLPLRQLGKDGPKVSAIGLGCMGIGAFYGKTDEEAAFKALTHAADRGMTFWDSADIYGTYHRVDASVPIEIVFEALREFVEAGKIKYLGLSEASPDTLRRAKAVPVLGDKLITVQMEYSPFTHDIEKNGFTDVAEELGVSVIAYSPLARGLLTGRFRSRADFPEDDLRLILPRWSEENFPKNLVIVDKLKELADKYNATPSQITLAWILAEHPTWVPIPGSRTAERVEENGNAALLTLAPEVVKEIRALTENAEVAGTRNRTHLSCLKAGLDGDSLPLAEWKGE